ncbi:MAG: cysteine--tRNA ligase [Erysipelotrichaceae bacterium]
MKLYNSKTTKNEEFVPRTAGEVHMYVCGPTVYNEAHIGNARPIIVFDTLRRLFEAHGLNVVYASNFTDVDDKIIQKAIDEGVDEKTITTRYIEAYDKVRNSLHTRPLTYAPKVTDTMDAIIAFIKELEDKGFAYNVDGNVYFRVNSVDNYGEISKQNVDDLLVGARIEEETEKESPLDFALWKKTDQGIQWDSPWGKGRPGWHTECVVMINERFHDMIDIHGGGMDLKFPHHENEAAQSKALFGHSLATTWMHNGMLNIDGEKMSKSLGNVMLAKDVIAKIGANATRWMMLQAHYRAPLNISEEGVQQAQTELAKLEAVLKQAEIKTQLSGIELHEKADKERLDAFLAALDDDLNTPNGFMELFETVKQLNQSLRSRTPEPKLVASLYQAVREMLDVMGIDIPVTVLTQEDKDDYAAYNEAKAKKDFAKSDEIRAKLANQGKL